MMKIQFEDVGRGNVSWVEDITAPFSADCRPILRAIRSKATIMSSDLGVVYDLDKNAGEVIVGGWRTIGTFKMLEKA